MTVGPVHVSPKANLGHERKNLGALGTCRQLQLDFPVAGLTMRSDLGFEERDSRLGRSIHTHNLEFIQLLGKGVGKFVTPARDLFDLS